MAHALCHPVWEKICSLDIKKKGCVGVFWTNYMQEHLRAETQINSGLNQPAFTTSINPWGSLWYAPLAAIYYINMLKFYMHVYYLPESLFCSSTLDLYHRLTNKKKKNGGGGEIMMCSVIPWPVGGNACILSDWVSAKRFCCSAIFLWWIMLIHGTLCVHV